MLGWEKISRGRVSEFFEFDLMLAANCKSWRKVSRCFACGLSNVKFEAIRYPHSLLTAHKIQTNNTVRYLNFSSSLPHRSSHLIEVSPERRNLGPPRKQGINDAHCTHDFDEGAAGVGRIMHPAAQPLVQRLSTGMRVMGQQRFLSFFPQSSSSLARGIICSGVYHKYIFSSVLTMMTMSLILLKKMIEKDTKEDNSRVTRHPSSSTEAEQTFDIESKHLDINKTIYPHSHHPPPQSTMQPSPS